MKKLLILGSILMLFVGCGNINKAFDPSFLFKNAWVVQSILGNSVDTSNFINGLPFIEFLPNGKVSGYDGCNKFNGNAELNVEKLTFGPLASTRKMCSNVDSDKFLNVLNQVTGFKKNGDKLELKGAAGKLMTFLPASQD